MLDITAYFPSAYAGWCKWCDLRIFPGDQLTFVDDLCVCDLCVEDARQFNLYLEFVERLEEAG